MIEPVEVHFQWRPQSRDPSDEMVLEAAINGRADALLTYNVADFAGPTERFRISVLRPGDLLKKRNHYGRPGGLEPPTSPLSGAFMVLYA